MKTTTTIWIALGVIGAASIGGVVYSRVRSGTAAGETSALTCADVPSGTACGEAGSETLCVAGACTKNVCGDRVVIDGEQCDDGNARSGDGCTSGCKWEPLPKCGNGVVDGREECDDGNVTDTDRCTVRCTVARCGDGAQTAGEACDDGNADDTDECTTACRPPTEEQLAAAVKRVSAGDSMAAGAAAGSAGSQRGAAGVTGIAGRVGSGGSANGAAGAAGAGAAGGASSGAPGAGVAGGVGSSANALKTTGSTAEGKEDDEACTSCRNQYCRNFQETDLVAGCYEAVNGKFGAKGGEEFLQTCIDVMTCAEQHHCAYDKSKEAAGCYCGSASMDECAEKGPARDAPCVKEWQLGTHSTVNIEVLQRMTDLTYPAAWAFFLLGCDREICKACVPEA